MNPIERILVATDFSAGAEAAAETALQLARQLKASVDVINVVDTSPLIDAYGDVAFRTQRINEIRQAAQEKTADFAAHHFRDLEGTRVYVRDGEIFLEILAAARELGSGLIVLGTHGRTGLAHLLIGSVAEKVVRKSTLPVLTVRGPH